MISFPSKLSQIPLSSSHYFLKHIIISTTHSLSSWKTSLEPPHFDDKLFLNLMKPLSNCIILHINQEWHGDADGLTKTTECGGKCATVTIETAATTPPFLNLLSLLLWLLLSFLFFFLSGERFIFENINNILYWIFLCYKNW